LLTGVWAMEKTMYEKRQQRGYNINQARKFAFDVCLDAFEDENIPKDTHKQTYEGWFWFFFDMFQNLDKEVEEKYPLE